MSAPEDSPVVLALRQLGHRLNNGDARMQAIETTVAQDRRDLMARFDRFDEKLDDNAAEQRAKLDKAIIDMRECGRQDHHRFDETFKTVFAKLDAHDDMLDDVAVMAGEKRGEGRTWQALRSAIATVIDRSGVVQIGFGLFIAFTAPTAWNIITQGVQAREAAAAEPAEQLQPMPVLPAHEVVLIPAEPEHDAPLVIRGR